MVSIVVGNDLNCPSTDGLDVGHASIIINLNGHTFTGSTGHYGVFNGSFSAVTIENGTVSGWGAGVAADGVTNKLTGLRASYSAGVGLVLGGTGSTALSNVSFKNDTGIFVSQSNVKVVSNTVRENTSYGIRVFSGTGAVLQTNQVENNSSHGIQDVGAGTVLTGNVTNANGGDGVNTVGDGTASVATTTANYNAAYGIEGAPGGKDGGGNLAKGNTQATQCKDVVCS